MEGNESMAKKRVLPRWMTEDKATVKKPCKTDVKKKEDRSPRKCTVYCMNEKELVDYALEILHKSKKKQVGETKTDTGVEGDVTESCIGEKPQTPPEASRTPNLPSPPPKDNTAMAKTQSDEEDDPLKYVREIFFR